MRSLEFVKPVCHHDFENVPKWVGRPQLAFQQSMNPKIEVFWWISGFWAVIPRQQLWLNYIHGFKEHPQSISD